MEHLLQNLAREEVSVQPEGASAANIGRPDPLPGQLGKIHLRRRKTFGGSSRAAAFGSVYDARVQILESNHLP